MVRFFGRAGEFIQCETRDGKGGAWELVIPEPNRPERVEQFQKGTELDERIRELQDGFLIAAGSGRTGTSSEPRR